MGGSRKPRQGVPVQQSQSGPWSGAQPYLSDVYQKAQQQYNQGVPQFGEGFTTAEDYYNKATRGEYGYGGEGFNAALDAAKNKIIPDVESRFAMGGRHGSGLEKTAETGAIADAFANLYNQERDRQQQAAAGAAVLSETRRKAPSDWLKDYASYFNNAPTQSSSTGYSNPTYPGSDWAKYLGIAAGALPFIF